METTQTPPLPKIPPEITPAPTLDPDPITDPQRGVLTITVTLTDPQGGELSENWH